MDSEQAHALSVDGGSQGSRNLVIGKLISLKLTGLHMKGNQQRKVFNIITAAIRPELVRSNLMLSTTSIYSYAKLLSKGCTIKAGSDNALADQIIMHSDGTMKGQQSLLNQITITAMPDRLKQ